MKTSPTAKDLRAYCRRLGITDQNAIEPIDMLVEQALTSEDPKGYLDTFAPNGDAAGDIDEDAEADRHEASTEPSVPDRARKPAAAAKAGAAIQEATVAFPFVAQIPEGAYVPANLHLDVQLRRPATARAFKRLSAALLDQGAKLANGRPVYSSANVVEWIVERIAAAMEPE